MGGSRRGGGAPPGQLRMGQRPRFGPAQRARGSVGKSRRARGPGLRLRAVLFDLDGVLVESRAVWFEVMRAIARKFGYSEISAEQMRRAWGQGIAEDVRMFYPGLTVEELE